MATQSKIIQFYYGHIDDINRSQYDISADVVAAMLWAGWIASTAPEELAKIPQLADAAGNTGIAQLICDHNADQGWVFHSMSITRDKLLTVIFQSEVTSVTPPPAPSIE